MGIHRRYFYPLWLRLWHGLNAALFLGLIFTGLNLQYASASAANLDFRTSIMIHNVCGIALSLNYLAFVALNAATGNGRQYLPRLKSIVGDMLLQARYYLFGIFRGDPHPFETTPQRKFNPLQQVTYLLIMYAVVPGAIITGIGLLVPDILVRQVFGLSGLTLTDLTHTVIGFILSLFLLGHLYLATTGATPTANFKAMLTGWHEDAHEPETTRGTDP